MPNPPRFTTTTKRPSSATLAIHKITMTKAIAIGGTIEQLENLFLRQGPRAKLAVRQMGREELGNSQPKAWKTLTGSKLQAAELEKALTLGIVSIEGESVGDLVDSISELAKQLRRSDTMAVFIDWER